MRKVFFVGSASLLDGYQDTTVPTKFYRAPFIFLFPLSPKLSPRHFPSVLNQTELTELREILRERQEMEMNTAALYWNGRQKMCFSFWLICTTQLSCCECYHDLPAYSAGVSWTT